MAIYDINNAIISHIYAITNNEVGVAYDVAGNVVFSSGESGLLSLTSALFKNLTNTYSSSSDSETYAAVNYDDSLWNEVKIPHDWSIRNNFNSASAASYDGGYLDGGDSWYRFKFNSSQFIGRDAFLCFDGVYSECKVYVNGEYAGENKYGYNPFVIDITDCLTHGDEVIAVFVRNRCPSSRWYSGSGIYRPCHILFTKADIKVSDIIITTPNIEEDIENDEGTAHVAFSVECASSSTLRIRLRYGDTTVSEISQTFADGDTYVEFHVDNPALWDVGEGNLYYVDFYSGDDIIASEMFGFRWFSFGTDGFRLNGNLVKLKGVCLHHDLGCLGAELHKGAIIRQLDMMQHMGCNAIRLTHNPSSKMMLDLCAERGIILVEELFDCWTHKKKTYDFGMYFADEYQEVIRTTFLRDRNNPAIVMWSIGNEIFSGVQQYTTEEATQIATQIYNCCKSYDNRPITAGLNLHSLATTQAVIGVVDVIGLNYASRNVYNSKRTSFPDKALYGSETTSAISTRGEYARDNENLYCSSYDDDVVGWGSSAANAIKLHFEDLPYLCGMFVWTGFDYIGEPTPFNKYPAKSSYFGIVDLAGFPKDIYYMYQSQWTDTPMLHILPHWNWSNGDTVNVWVYSNCEQVELFLNGTSLGVKTSKGSKYQYEWSVPWQSGTITAVGTKNGNVVCQESITTAGNPDSVSVKKSVFDELCFFEAQVVDEDANPCPLADNQLVFTVTGGEIIGVDNGNSASVEPFKNTNTRKAFNGKALCVVKPNIGVAPSEVTCIANIINE